MFCRTITRRLFSLMVSKTHSISFCFNVYVFIICIFSKRALIYIENLNLTYRIRCLSLSFSDNICSNKRQLPQRKKAKAISEDFVDSDSLIHTKEEKVSYSPYSANSVSFEFHDLHS